MNGSSKAFQNFFISLFFISALCAGNVFPQTPDAWPDEYIGTWKLTGAGGETRYINLLEDRRAITTSDRTATGSWLYHPDEGEVRIEWSNGWADVMTQEKNVYKYYGYAPGTDPGSKPTNEWTAEKVAINPFEYEGVWSIVDLKGKGYQLKLNLDSTAEKGLDKGIWIISDGKFQIKWPDGSTDFITQQEGMRFKLISYASGASLDGKPTSVADAERVAAVLQSDPNATEIDEQNS